MKQLFMVEQEVPVEHPKYCSTCDLAYEHIRNFCGVCGTKLEYVSSLTAGLTVSKP